MKKKRNISFRTVISDTLTFIVCVAGIFAAVYLLKQDFNYSLSNENGLPIGVIYFKKNSAQRRFKSRNLWERLKVQSTVYEGDFIRTDEDSETYLVLENKTQIQLNEKTLIQLTDSKGSLEFIQGTISIIASNNASPVMIKVGNSLVSVKPNSSAIITIPPAGNETITPVIAVTSGSVDLNKNADQKVVREIKKDEVLQYETTQNKTVLSITAESDNQIVPESLQSVLQTVTSRVKEIARQTGLPVSEPAATTETVKPSKGNATTESGGDRPLEFWGDRPLESTEFRGDRPLIKVLLPPPGYLVEQDSNGNASVRFYWQGNQSIKIEIAQDKSFQKKIYTQIFDKNTNRADIKLMKNQLAATMYWQITLPESTDSSKTEPAASGKLNVSLQDIHDETEKEIAGAIQTLTKEIKEKKAQIEQEKKRQLEEAAKAEEKKRQEELKQKQKAEQQKKAAEKKRLEQEKKKKQAELQKAKEKELQLKKELEEQQKEQQIQQQQILSLSKIELLSPANNKFFTESDFPGDDPEILFSWTDLPENQSAGPQEYIFLVKNNEGKVLIQKETTSPSYKITTQDNEIELLSENGIYTWTVYPKNLPENLISQYQLNNTFRFTINLQEVGPVLFN
ncbi:MAG: hypothetical protein MJ160_03435 [Treponema sp.]|nr:hypothetical protein [Treponema sp.]